jgi:hypothetical protein
MDCFISLNNIFKQNHHEKNTIYYPMFDIAKSFRTKTGIQWLYSLDSRTFVSFGAAVYFGIWGIIFII